MYILGYGKSVCVQTIYVKVTCQRREKKEASRTLKLSCNKSLLYLHYFIILSVTSYWSHFLCTLREIHAIYRDLRLNRHFHIFVDIVFHQIIKINYFKNVHNFMYNFGNGINLYKCHCIFSFSLTVS